MKQTAKSISLSSSFCRDSGKIRYETVNEALTALAALRKKHKNLRLYRCGYCGDYHLGRKPR